jgi:hypothetical protein
MVQYAFTYPAGVLRENKAGDDDDDHAQTGPESLRGAPRVVHDVTHDQPSCYRIGRKPRQPEQKKKKKNRSTQLLVCYGTVSEVSLSTPKPPILLQTLNSGPRCSTFSEA